MTPPEIDRIIDRCNLRPEDADTVRAELVRALANVLKSGSKRGCESCGHPGDNHPSDGGWCDECENYCGAGLVKA